MDDPNREEELGLSWARRTGGALPRTQGLRWAPALVGGTFSFLRDRLWWALGIGPRRGAAPQWPEPVDSSFCRRAEEQARDMQSESTMGHAYRTFTLGSALAQLDGLTVDPELLYAGALLHDSGIEHPVPDECFTLRGAEALLQVAAAEGLEERRATEAADAIVRHITPGLDRHTFALGYAIQSGAMADLAGVRLWELPRDLVSRAMHAHPPSGAARYLAGCWKREAKLVPRGRARYLATWARFPDAIRLGPTHG